MNAPRDLFPSFVTFSRVLKGFLAPIVGFLLTMLLYNPMAWSQEPLKGSPFLTHYAKKSYSGGTQNWAIAQGPSGMIYVGNNQGLLEFDGIRWQRYRLPNQTIVRSLAMGSEGEIFVGGQGEFGFFSPNSQGQLAYHSLMDQIPAGTPTFDDIWKVLVTGERVLFLSHQALFIWEEGGMKVFLPESRFENAFHAGGKVFIQDWDRGLMLFEGDRLVTLKEGAFFSGKRIASLISLPNHGQIMVATEDDGIYRLEGDRFVPWRTSMQDFFRQYHVYSAILLEEGTLAFGTTQNGLLLTDTLGSPLFHLNKGNGLSNNTLLCIFQDRDGNLWLGLDNGITFLEIQSPFSRIGAHHSIDGTAYAACVHNKKLFLGTNQGLFFLDLNKKQDFFNLMKFQSVDRLEGQVWSLDTLESDLWVGHHQGAFLLDYPQITSIASDQGAWRFMRLKQQPGYAIEGTYAGLVLFKKEGKEWVRIGPIQGFNESSRIMEEDKEGNIWVTHFYKGIFKLRLNAETGKLERIDHYGIAQGLPDNIANQVVMVRDELLFLTIQGVYRYDSEKDHFIPEEELNKLLGEKVPVQFLQEDQMGNIWFLAGNEFGQLLIEPDGLFNKIQKRILNKLREEIVSGFELIYTVNENQILIGTEEGFVVFHPQKMAKKGKPFKTQIKRVEGVMHGKDTLLFGGHTQGNQLQIKEEKDFPTDLKSFHFSFFSPVFNDLPHLQFQYYLEGFDSDWSEWSKIAQKEYTNLDPGSYTFWVKARNSFGEESEAASYSFSIASPWYKSPAGKFGFAMLGGLAMLSIILLLRRRYRKQNKALRKAQEEELLRRDSEFQEARERSEAEIIRLRNEKLKAAIQHKNQELASSAMHLVQKTEMLTRVKNELKRLSSKASPANQEQIRNLIRTINADIRLDDNWEQFEHHFDQVHEQFIQRLREKHPELTPKDLRLCAYLRMNLSTKEIAPLMNISVRGVEISRYRLRKKLNLDTEENLVDFMLGV